MPRLPYARIASTLVMTLSIGLFGYSTATSFWDRVIHVDVLKWPLGLPHPHCPDCRCQNTTVLSHDQWDELQMRCDKCGSIFTAKGSGLL